MQTECCEFPNTSGSDQFGRVADQDSTTTGGTDKDRYQYDKASNVTSRTDTLHTGFNDSYTYDGLNRLTASDRGSGSTDDQSWPLGRQDANYNVTAIANSSGTVQERFVYNAYGAFFTTDASWSTTTEGKAWIVNHQGLRFDAGTGWYDNRNRTYSPTMMRFAQQEPNGAKYIDGQNLYRGLEDNPTNHHDASGLLSTVNDINGDFTVIPVDHTDLPKYEHNIDPLLFTDLTTAGADGYEAIYKPDAAHAALGMNIHFGQAIKSSKPVAPKWDTGDWKDPGTHRRGLPAYAVNPDTGRSDNDHATGALGLSGMYSFYDSPGGTEVLAYVWEIELVAFTPCRNRILGAARFNYTNGSRTAAASYDMRPAPWARGGGGWTIHAQPPSGLAMDVIKKW